MPWWDFEDVPSPKELVNKLPDFEDVNLKVKVDQFEDVPLNVGSVFFKKGK